MKLKLIEHEGCFSIDAEAESMADAALLTRFALNATKEVRALNANAFKDGTFTGSLVIGKRKNADSSIR